MSRRVRSPGVRRIYERGAAPAPGYWEPDQHRHAFQKKSKTGIATPKKDLALIKAHLKKAEEHYKSVVEGNHA